MKRLLLAFCAALLWPLVAAVPVRAQTVFAVTVTSCGTPPNTPVAGGAYPIYMDTTGKLCTSGTGGGGSTSVTATAAAPTYTEGSTSNPLSVGLKGGLRVYGQDSGGGDITDTVNHAWKVNIVAGSSSGAVAQGSTTSGQSGGLVQCAATTAAPSYTTAQTNPINCDTAGNLRVNVVTGSTSGAVAQGSTTSGQTGGLTQAAVTTASPTYTTAQTNPLSLDPHGSLRVLNIDSSGNPISPSAATPAGTNVIGQTGVDQTTPGVSNHVDAGLSATTTGGCTPYGLTSAATTNPTSVKGSTGTLCSLSLVNTTATLYYLRLYNAASAPTCSSATNFVLTVPIPASATGAGVVVNTGSFGWAFGTGIAFCLTGGGSSTDNTNAATGVYLAASYK